MLLKQFPFFTWLVFLSFYATGQQKNALLTPYEIHKTNYTATYQECKDWYQKADSAFETVKVLDYGLTDGGHPLQLAVLSMNKDFSPASIHQKNKRIVLIMNAIHPGEPEGVDASMILLRDMATKKEWEEILKDVVVCIIPQYNIEGVINRTSYSRANQDGPESYGFRGNGQNLDLNRDFIKCDSKNTIAFETLFREWDPDVFIDNHTSDGADYQYTLTYITNMPGSLPAMLEVAANGLTKAIVQKTKADGYEMMHYVETMKETPDSGIMGFAATPRYSMGYVGLFNTIAYTVETHMLKPFDQRLQATYEFMQTCITEVHQYAATIGNGRMYPYPMYYPTPYTDKLLREVTMNPKLDTSHFEMIDFKGYEAIRKPSQLTGGPRLYYDRTKPYTKKVKYYNDFKPTLTVTAPKYYILPQEWTKAVDLLKLNRIHMTQLDKDSTFVLDMYIIDSYDNAPGKTPSNGHYQHHNVKAHTEKQTVTFHKGDYLINPSYNGLRYVVQTLEPEGEDSYFSWNFFDGMLQQREYFSDYVFEDMAYKYIQEHPAMKTEFENKKKTDTAFAANAGAQLDWVYRHSPYFEKTYMRYPVGRIME